MSIAVFGANGPTGLQVVRQALAAQHRVIAVTRKPEDYPLHAPALEIAAADVTDARAVERALRGARAVISAFGVPYARKQITVYSRGTGTIMRAMRRHGIARLVCVSSTTVASEELPEETLLWRKVLVPFLRRVVGRTLYDDMERMEALVSGSDLDWTIVRPGALNDTDAPPGAYRLAEHRLAGRYTARTDLAHALLAEASTSQHVRSVVEVISKAGPRSPAATFLREAFGVGR